MNIPTSEINMPKIVFIEFNGAEHRVDAPIGDSVMQAATSHMVPGIVADCGGNCACATCHVYIEESWSTRTNPPSKEEKEMIECALHVTPASRLSCQVHVTPELDGLIVRLPESQT
jgi:ferredoxin, 2Fe-2S